ncbi:hypothetical protein C2L98_12180 [Enterococcus gallinarum]|nr:hypothetical protein C2L98_12180 [Enterococcus gallinarum]
METIEIEDESNKKLSSNDQEICCWTVFFKQNLNGLLFYRHYKWKEAETVISKLGSRNFLDIS